MADPQVPRMLKHHTADSRPPLAPGTGLAVLLLASVLLLLGLIWGGTLHLVRVEHANAARDASHSTRDLAGLYEIQMTRALREIDLALGLVRYASEHRGLDAGLPELEREVLLPSSLILSVSVADARGKVVAYNHSGEPQSIADQPHFAYFQQARLGDQLYVGPASPNPTTQARRLLFSRKISLPDGRLAGVVSVTVDLDYFTSAYDKTRMGERGVIGVLDEHGRFLVRRTGDRIFSDNSPQAGPHAPPGVRDTTEPVLELNPWDGEKRYTVLQGLRAFPFAIVLGLSEHEQLAAFHASERSLYWQAGAASGLLLLLALLLWQLGRSQLRMRKAQAQLAQSEKLASIGMLAAGVAHEINNPVGFVRSNIGTLDGYVGSLFKLLDAYQEAEASLPDPAAAKRIEALRQQIELDYLREDIPALMRETKDGIARVSKIVQDLKNFSRTDSAQEWQLVDLHEGIDSTLNVVNNEIKYKADVIKEYSPLPLVECLPSEINQVVMNLAVNAAQAIVDHGTITVRTGQQGEGSGAEVWFEVSDTGCGIKPDHLAKIFDPFFTTKPVGKGTGLGLSLSYGIVKKHNGRLDVSSEPGKGSTFRVTLPLRHAARPDAAASTPGRTSESPA